LFPSAITEFGKPDFVLYNSGAFPANSLTAGMGSKTSVDLSIEDQGLVILGAEYAGEMKKGVFTVANYFAPKRGILSMHCSATADKQTGHSSLLFGLSGTGKTTLSADPSKQICRTACRQDERTRHTRMACEHWLERWGLWRREAYQAG
jgi:phosphoenolpyruvate carboxykinase (ATP)